MLSEITGAAEARQLTKENRHAGFELSDLDVSNRITERAKGGHNHAYFTESELSPETVQRLGVKGYTTHRVHMVPTPWGNWICLRVPVGVRCFCVSWER